MSKMHASAEADYRDDASLVDAMRRGEAGAFRAVMTQYNQRLFRVARGFVGTDHEAEDVVQQAYVDAFQQVHTFRGEASLATWLTRIVVNEAKQRIRNRKVQVSVDVLDARTDGGQIIRFPLAAHEDPIAGAARSQLRYLLEEAIGTLPVAFRAVFVLRELEECTVEETAQTLGIRPETVKTRLHRARRLIRLALETRVGSSLKDAFQFQGIRCARISERVLHVLRAQGHIQNESA